MEKLPKLETYRGKKNWIKRNFLKNGNWQKRKVKSYFEQLIMIDQLDFIEYVETAYSGTKLGDEIEKTFSKLSNPGINETSLPIKINPDEFNLVVDCLAYLKETKLIKINSKRLASALVKIFDAGYSESTIYEKLRRDKCYGNIIENIQIVEKNFNNQY
jgi:hypothetical protein